MKGEEIFSGTLFALVVAALILPGCIAPADDSVVFREIPRFGSYDELAGAFLSEQGKYREYGIIGGMRGGVLTTVMPTSMPMAAESADSSAGGAGVDYSTTNIQVEGVDEADIVKSDGRYIYNFSGNRLVITDAYPIETAGIVSKTELAGIYPQEMFVSGDKLLLFGGRHGYYGYGGRGLAIEESVSTKPAPDIAPEPDCVGCGWDSGAVVVRLYDISDRSAPVLKKDFEFEGSYLTSRMIGGYAYFVVTSWPGYYVLEGGEGNIIPLMAEDGVERQVAEATEIGYIPPMPAENFVTIASINLGDGELEKETIVGNARNVFASLDNIYLAGTAWLPPSNVPVVKDVERAIIGDVEKTVINKFALVSGEIKYVGQGSVPGHVLNQFSMDEFGGNFRIATTAWNWNTGGQSSNNLYVLDAEMATIGELEDLAPGESIYSARFMGEKAYLVTFKKVDPLFVIDLSTPTEPKVLGKLKIPGYSDYLHPIDETHIIGVGKTAIESTYGDFAWYQGIKMAVFDVSDVENPVEMHKIVIGDRGTDSYALHDHKAFLYDKEKELLVLPIMLAEIPEEQKRAQGGQQGNSEMEVMIRDVPLYGEPVFQGAFVYRLTLENGFEERGRITHVSEEDELKRGYYFGDDYSVKRALYIGNVLYTLSESMLKAHDLGTLAELKEFVFG